MKRLILTVLFAVLISGIAFAQQKPAMDFKKTEHNFGIIKEEMDAVSTQFEFTNTGKKPLVIQDTWASCGCTKPSFAAKPVLPGETGYISVSYSTVRRPGTFNKTIKVYTNVPDTVYVLTIKGNVTPRE